MRVRPLVFVLLVVLLVAVDSRAEETPRMGGVLKVATIGEPPTLDIAMSTATQVYELMWHASESLFTYDRNFSPIPMLANNTAGMPHNPHRAMLCARMASSCFSFSI